MTNLDALRRTQERLTAYPSSTIFLAAEAVLDLPALALVCDLPVEVLDLSGADAVEWIEQRLSQEGATVPAPPPTVEEGADLLLALGRIGEAWEHLEAARVALAPSAHAATLLRIRGELEAMAKAIGADIEGRTLGLEAA